MVRKLATQGLRREVPELSLVLKIAIITIVIPRVKVTGIIRLASIVIVMVRTVTIAETIIVIIIKKMGWVGFSLKRL